MYHKYKFNVYNRTYVYMYILICLYANLENSAVATGLERSVFIPIPKKGNAKECSNYRTIALISQASNAQNSPSQASAIGEQRTSRCSSWF